MCATPYAGGCGGWVLLLGVSDVHVLEVQEMMRCVRLRTLEAAEGALCLMEALEVLEVPEVMRCVLLGALYAGGLGGRVLLRDFKKCYPAAQVRCETIAASRPPIRRYAR